MNKFKFGKNAPIIDDRTLKFKKYAKTLPPVPEAADFMSKVPSWPMYANDTLGDCVAAAPGHQIEGWTYSAGKGSIPTLADVIKFYEISGYNPSDPSTDQGWSILPMLKNFRSTGIGGDKIVAFVQLETGNWHELTQSVVLFGSAVIGLNLPDAVVPDSPDAPDWTTIPWIWTPDMQPDPNNGHCVPIMAYKPNAEGGFIARFVSWAASMVMNRAFYENGTDEAWAVVTADFIEQDQQAPSGFNIAQLLSDLSLVIA
jgi:hypothetical protein